MSGSLPTDWDDVVAAANAGTRDAGQWRSLRTLSGPGPLVTFEGRDVVSFSSNDYLGLASTAAGTFASYTENSAGKAHVAFAKSPVIN